ncbi:MAG: hypothetical protein KDD61_17925 [Bdellovibrionales bacterium]|nr:hypothetical protein [Bdellovibrionales bacterium]
MLTINIDSPPLSDAYQACRDHSGQQLYAPQLVTLSQSSWPAFPVQSFCVTEKVEVNNESTQYRYHFDKERSAMAQVSPEIFAHHILTVLNSMTFPFERFLLHNLESINTTKDSVLFKLKQTDHLFDQKLASFAFCLGPEEGVVSPYQIRSRSTDQWNFESNFDFLPPLIFRRVKEPELNYNQYMNQTVDVTADTAFPLDKPTEEAVVDRSGIFMCLDFETDNWEIQKSVEKIVHRGELNQSIHHGFLEASSFSKVPMGPKESNKNFLKKNLRLGFDPYYPNHIIAEKLSEQLSRAGWIVELVEDTYGNPTEKVDLRLVLIKGSFPSSYSIYYGLLGGHWFQEEREKKQKYFSLLQRLESSREPEHEVLYDLEGLLRSVGAPLPLLEVVSYTLISDRMKKCFPQRV